MPHWLIELFDRYGYGAVFVGVMLENAGLPVPGETVLLAGAAMAHFGQLSLVWVVAAAAAGAVIGDNIGFLVGRRGGRPFVVRFGSALGLTPPRLARFDEFFDRHGPRTIFIARFVTGLRVFGALLAGASGFRWRTFLFYNATGAVTWAIVIAVAGYLLGGSWEAAERWIGGGGVLALAAIVVAAGLMAVRARRRRGRAQP